MQIRPIILFVLAIILFGMVQRVQSQIILTKEDPALIKGTNDYEALRYASAIKELLLAIEKDPENVKIQEMLAGSYRNIRNYDEAVRWYAELSKQKQIKPEWALYYAEALANKQQYEQSEQWYLKFLSLKPDDRRAFAFSRAKIDAFKKNAADWKVSYTNINTDGSEYSPLYYKDGLIFVSNREIKTRYIFAWDQTPYSDLYVIDHLSDITEAVPDSPKVIIPEKKALFSIGVKKSKEVEAEPIINAPEPGAKAYLLKGRERSTYHEGPSVILPEGSLMFTRNNYNGFLARKSDEGVIKLKLYTATGINWDKIASFPYNNNEYSTGHPAINLDGSILVFASDRPGGYGGSDLYFCVRTSDNGKWGDPVNLGQRINTEGNEMFPFLDKKGKLFFASTGHPGLGGLDMFEVTLRDMKPTTDPRNMGSPVNSSADDFGLIIDENGKNGFFSSNRRGNDDIYQFTRLAYSVALKGSVIDAKTNQPLGMSKVFFRHNGITDSLQTNAGGEFTRPLAKETDYDIHGRMPSYINGQTFVSTIGVNTDSTINIVLKLSRPDNPQQWVIDNCDSLKNIFKLQSIYYDLDKSFVRADAQPALDQIAGIMKQHPEISIITSSHTDSRASEDYNRSLSLRRGESAKAYLASKGIDERRVEVKYYGKSRLVNACTDGVPCPEEDQQKNRRTEFEVIINGVNLTQVSCKN